MMDLTPETLDLLKTFGPYVLSGIGALLLAICSMLMGLLRYGWKLHQKRMDMMATALKKLAESVGHYESSNHEEHRKVWDSIQGLRAELQLSSQKSDHIKMGLLKTEGALDKQIDRVDAFLKVMGKVESKLDAVFRHIDAPKRATDT